MKSNTQLRNHLAGKSLSLAASILSLALLVTTHADAAVSLYSEPFTTASTTSVSTFGWTAGKEDGASLSSSTTGQFFVPNISAVRMGVGVTDIEYALVSDAPTIDPSLYSGGLDITISQRWNAVTGGAWRLLVQVGSTVYASPQVAATSSYTNITYNTSASGWSEWIGETSMTGLVGSAFNVANISGTTGILAPGSITKFGVLGLDTTAVNAELIVTQYDILGIPEPSAALLGSLGLLALLRRRRA